MDKRPTHNELLAQNGKEPTASAIMDSLNQILNSINAVIYVSDIENFEILFANNMFVKIYGEVAGKTCWKVMKEKSGDICNNCLNIRKTGTPNFPENHRIPYEWEYQNKLNNRWYEATMQTIVWHTGQKARLVIATDFTTRKRDEKKLFRYLVQQKMLTQISNTFNSVDSFDKKISLTLEAIGMQLKVDHIYIYLKIKGKKTKKKLHYTWSNENAGQVKIMTPDSQKGIRSHLSIHKILKVKQYNEVPPFLIPYLEGTSVESLLFLPLYVNNKYSGFLGLEQCNYYRSWHIFETDMLTKICNEISKVKTK